MSTLLLISATALSLGLRAPSAPLAHAPAQDADETAAQSAEPPLVSVAELVLEHYEPLHVDPHELAHSVQSMIGRHFYVRERGGYHASEPIEDVSVLGGSLVIYDTAEYAARVLATCRALDVAPREEAPEPPGEAAEILRYRPRYVSLPAALSTLRRFVEFPVGSGLDALQEQNVLVITGTPNVLASTLATLAQIDVPRDQIVLSCYLVRALAKGAGEPAPEEGRLPQDLVDDLGRLVPQFRFELYGFALLQTAVPSSDVLQIHIDTRSAVGYELSFLPAAFDTESATLSVERCTLVRVRSAGDGASQRLHETVFTTSTVFRGGEYTVIGGTGSDPVFLVVRVSPARG
jgi:hypothetical protein